MRLLAASLIALTPLLPAFGQAPSASAPRLVLQELLQGPKGPPPTLNSLHGKVVVLEFWATWCGPCVASIPHLNQLADQFSGKVQFIAVDDEAPATVKRFLVSHPMHAWIGLDRSQATFRNYGVASRPKTIVIDPKGRVLKTGVPEDVTPQLLEAAVHSTSTSSPLHINKAPASAAVSESVPRFKISIEDAAPGGHLLLASDNGTVQAHSASPTQILGLLYEANDPDIVLEAKLPELRLDLYADAPGVKEAAMLKATQAVFDSTFQIEPQWEMRERDVYILTADETVKDKLKVSTGSHSYMLHQGTKLEDMKTGMASFSAQLASILKTPVLDETGKTERYDIAFTLAADTEDELSKQLSTFGLHLERTRKVVRSLIVR